MARKSSWLVFLACLFLVVFGGCSARAEVTLTAEEWQTLKSEWSKLESRTSEREKLIVKSEQVSKELKNEVNGLNQELTRLKVLQAAQEKSLNEIERALKESEKSFETWKKDELKRRTSLERKKRAWQIIALAAVVAAAVK
ncbi:MAG: hypothetical protein MR209_00010 [Veillonellaceae bacterium]|nr:hypothetical protein [Veillonellaceae bacterium]